MDRNKSYPERIEIHAPKGTRKHLIKIAKKLGREVSDIKREVLYETIKKYS